MSVLAGVSFLLGASGPLLGAAESRPSSELARMLSSSSRVLIPDTPKQVQLERLYRRAAPPELRVLVVGCDFSDSLMWGRDLAQFVGWPEQTRVAQRIPGTDTPMFAAHDSTYFDLQMRRVDEYFRSVSFGRFSLQWDVHPTIVNLPRAMGYYGDPDSADVRSVRMAAEVIAAVDDAVEFDRYDTLVLIHAGAGSETDILGDDPEQIPSTYLDQRDFEDAARAGLLSEPSLPSGEGPVEHVLILPEAESQDAVPSAGLPGFFDVLGVYCFEFGLRLGMLSLTDFTPAGQPDSQGIGNFGLMGFGLFTGLSIVPSAPSAINRVLMGWTEPVEVSRDADVRLAPMGSNSAPTDTLVVRVPISDREYWLLEYRLQDPNGDLFYSFQDSNANRVPDFYDADSDSGNGWPTGPYDPSEDWWEVTLDSEWDYFMSEHPARSSDRCMRAGGSGVYIYHVDERVIENSLLSGVNTINADPAHKGVDVEEADGIQDLDSARPSAYILGWDGDSWRGEGATEFGPDTVPSTDSVAGVPTGVRFSGFSPVVVDSLPRDLGGDCTGFVYRPFMEFRVEFGGAAGAPTIAASRNLTGIAPQSTVRAVDLGRSGGDATADGILELVCLADSGRVLGFDAGLDEWFDGDGDASTFGILAQTSGPRGLVEWVGDPVMEDFDGDGRLDLLAASTASLIAVDATGLELLDGDADPSTQGPLWSPARGEIVSPILSIGASSPRLALVVAADDSLRAVSVQWSAGTPTLDSGPTVAGRALGPATLTAEASPRVVVPFADDESGGFLILSWESGVDPVRLRTPTQPTSVPATTWASEPGTLALFWRDQKGFRHRSTVSTDGGPGSGRTIDAPLVDRGRDRGSGAPSALVGADLRAGGGEVVLAEVVGGTLVVCDSGLSPRVGFPFAPPRVAGEAVTDSVVASVALVDLDGDEQVEALWSDGEGVAHAVDLSGRELAGWPFVGPAEALDAPLVADLDADGRLEVVLVSRFLALRQGDAPAQSFGYQPRGAIWVLDLTAPSDAYTPVGSGALGPRNAGVLAAGMSPAGGGPSFEAASVAIQPNPAVGSTLRVRVMVGQGATVRAVLYNLEGEEVARSAAVFTEAQTAFDEFVDISGLGSGMYVCRIVSGSEAILRPFAVAR